MTKRTMSLFSRSRERRRLRTVDYTGIGYSSLQTAADSDEGESEELRVVQKENVIERVLQPGDTLHSISLQYHVPVAELKRVNNILRENEIHARLSLRIPVRPISSLVDLTPVHVAPQTPRTLSIGSGCDPQEFLAAMDRDLARIRAATVPVRPGQSSEILFSGLQVDISEGGACSGVRCESKTSACSGSDWGLGWQQMLACSLLLTLLLPVLLWYRRTEEHAQ